jgi:hypothetical protein
MTVLRKVDKEEKVGEAEEEALVGLEEGVFTYLLQ